MLTFFNAHLNPQAISSLLLRPFGLDDSPVGLVPTDAITAQ